MAMLGSNLLCVCIGGGLIRQDQNWKYDLFQPIFLIIWGTFPQYHMYYTITTVQA